MAKRAIKTGSGLHPERKSEDLQGLGESLTIDGGLESPARRLQSMLDSNYNHDDNRDQVDRDKPDSRWSMRRTMLFVTLFCGTFWALVWVIVSVLIA